MSKDFTKIGILNLFLLVFAFLLAYIAPITTFVIAYALLGPLHYLTQLNWLKDVTFSKYDKSLSITVIIAAILTTAAFVSEYYFDNNTHWYFYRNLFAIIIILACFIVFVIIQNIKIKLAITILLPLILILFFLSQNTFYLILIGIMFVSVIHVYFFTMMHMLSGFFKNKSKIDLINILVMLSFPLITFLIPHSWSILNLEIINSNQFVTGLSENLQHLFGWSYDDVSNIVFIKSTWFIAFAYLYHYLNWFSKTKIIHWDNSLTKQKTITITIISLVCSSIYLIKFEYGLLATLFLSYLHVFAELPLNIISGKHIIKGVIRKK